VRSEDFVIGGTDEARLKFSDPLGYADFGHHVL